MADIENKDEGVKIEEVDDDMPELEDAMPELEEAADQGGVDAHRGASRPEKKARKALAKFNLKPVHGVMRVVARTKGGETIFVVNQPDVMQTANGSSYVFFGQATGDDSAAQQAAMAQAAAGLQAGGDDMDDDDIPDLVEASPSAVEDDGDVDENGVNPKHIELVLEQCEGKTRAQAIKALKNTNGDIVNAIMELSMG